METEVVRKPFNTRGFIAVVLVTAGAILPVSGIMNHQLQMETLTTARHFWMAVHNMAATMFVLASAGHIVLNWKPLVRHSSKAVHMMLTKEAVAALAVVLGVVGLFAGHALHVR